jgi:hypothetical protein
MAAIGMLLALGTGAPLSASAQALDCSVSLDRSNLGTEYTFLDELEQRVEEYLNTQRWTEDRFREVERINCRVQIIVQEAPSLTSFRARLVVATLRPIYDTAQATPVVRINDNTWNFEYARGTPLVRRPNQYDDLTSVLDFYANVILGYDYDTFSELGGTPYFERARQIAERAQSNNASGWSSLSGSQSRTTLITQILDPTFEPLRRAYFTYHFKGLDRFVTDTEAARQSILNVLEQLDELSQSTSRTYPLDLFFAAKYEEIAAIFAEGEQGSAAYSILSRIDPAHMSEYNALVN